MNPFVNLAIITMIMVFRLAMSIVRGIFRLIVSIFRRPAFWLEGKLIKGISFISRMFRRVSGYTIHLLWSWTVSVLRGTYTKAMSLYKTVHAHLKASPKGYVAQSLRMDPEEIFAVDKREYEEDMMRMAAVSPLAGYSDSLLAKEARRINPSFLNPSVN